jgi:phage terminase large subunit-like protein
VSKKAKGEFYFDEKTAKAAVDFFEKLLHHSKGEWAGKLFVLESWQKEKIIRPLFGWKRSDGTRKYRRAYVEMGRKNGKSSIGAGIALYLLYADSEPGAEIYSVAADRDQASIVFEEAKSMVETSPDLLQRSEIFKRSIVNNELHGSYKVLSSDAPTKHGKSTSGLIFDELHAQAGRDLWDSLTTSTGARKSPLVVALTTAGFDRNSICFEQHEYARQVLEGIVDDPEFFAFIAAAPEKADWTDPEVWKLANPNLDVTIKRDYLATECHRAQISPAYENTFRRLHLSQWTQQETRFLPIDIWDQCDQVVDPQLLEGSVCYGGLDLASSSDIAAFVLDFPNEAGEPEHHAWLPFFWIPEENMIERERKDRVPYSVWVREGLIKATEGNVIDYGVILEDIIELGKIYNIREIAFDRWGAVLISTQLQGAGFQLVGEGQGFLTMSQPTKDLLRLVMDKRLAHGGNKVLRWMCDNLMVRQDPAGNFKPDKSKSTQKIDGIVAGIMALDRAMRHENDEGPSVYEERGILTF